MPAKSPLFGAQNVHFLRPNGPAEKFAEGCLDALDGVRHHWRQNRKIKSREVSISCNHKLPVQGGDGIHRFTLRFGRDLPLVHPENLGFLLSHSGISFAHQSVVVETSSDNYNVYELGVNLCLAFGWKLVNWENTIS